MWGSLEMLMVRIAKTPYIDQTQGIAQFFRCLGPTAFFVPIAKNNWDPCFIESVNLLLDEMLQVCMKIFSGVEIWSVYLL